jgi:hypothetical protein
VFLPLQLGADNFAERLRELQIAAVVERDEAAIESSIPESRQEETESGSAIHHAQRTMETALPGHLLALLGNDETLKVLDRHSNTRSEYQNYFMNSDMGRSIATSVYRP